MIKKIVSIMAGYAIFVLSSVALFMVSGQQAHADATTGFIIFTIVYGIVFSFIAGLVTQLIAKTKNLTLNYILAFILAGFATFSLLKSSGNHWTQWIAIFIFAPATILGGLLYIKR
jgi:multisubunit Na+/H+ antiporter MnhE subunit